VIFGFVWEKSRCRYGRTSNPDTLVPLNTSIPKVTGAETGSGDPDGLQCEPLENLGRGKFLEKDL
jgi:hypothetical protein